MPILSPTSRAGKKIYLSLWDVFWALISPIAALYLRDPGILFTHDWTLAANYWAFSSSFAILAFFALRLQDGMTRYFSVHEALDLAEAVLVAQLMTCAAMFTLTRLDGIPRSMPLIHGLVLFSGLFAARIFMRIVSGADRSQDYHALRQRMILIGASPFAASFIQLLKAYAPNTQPVLAVLDNNPAMTGRAVSGVPVLGAPQELEAIIAEFSVHGVGTDRVVIAGEADSLSSPVLQEIERVCRKRQIKLSFLPRMIGISEKTSENATILNPIIAPAEQPSLTLSSYFSVKRAIDIFGAIILLTLLSPLLLVGALLVILDVGTPFLFWQERTGWNGRPFLIYKFRTLKAPFDDDGKPILGNRKPSAIGHFLRVTRIDELPQLLNVLLGDMSLVGPRPLLPEDQPSTKSLRLLVRPGITGWAQVNGAKLLSKEEKDNMDEHYIRNASLLFDFKILMATLKLLLRTRLSAAEAEADVEQVQSRKIKV